MLNYPLVSVDEENNCIGDAKLPRSDKDVQFIWIGHAKLRLSF